jgi:tripartite-type tricarboxylate transporter receptor subunit TctC
LTDVAAGHVQLMIDSMVSLLPMARSGQIKVLAITAAQRSKVAPDILMSAESGMPGLEFASWSAFGAVHGEFVNPRKNGAVPEQPCELPTSCYRRYR